MSSEPNTLTACDMRALPNETAASMVSPEIGPSDGAVPCSTALAAWRIAAILTVFPTSFPPQSGIPDRSPPGLNCDSTSASQSLHT